MDDVCAAFAFAVEHAAASGPLNVTAPGAVRNAEFARTLGAVLHRPAFFPVPPFALRILFGEMADETLLASALVRPAALESAGFGFAWPALEPALRHLLASGPSPPS